MHSSQTVKMTDWGNTICRRPLPILSDVYSAFRLWKRLSFLARWYSRALVLCWTQWRRITIFVKCLLLSVSPLGCFTHSVLVTFCHTDYPGTGRCQGNTARDKTLTEVLTLPLSTNSGVLLLKCCIMLHWFHASTEYLCRICILLQEPTTVHM